MTKIISLAKPSISNQEIQNVLKCLKKGWVSSTGEFVKKFENNFSKYIGKGYALAVSNGTVAIELALKTFKVGKNDEVIIPDFTFAGTINAVLNTSATPVIVDVNKDDWTIDVNEIKKSINKRTKAIIPVHIYGQPAKIREIRTLAKKNNLAVIEDAAEALGAFYKKKKIGYNSQCSTFSFFANKLITTGEGGMVLFNSKKKAEFAKKLRNQGRDSKKFYWHTDIGGNYRMSNVQAAIGCAQLKKIKKFYNQRKKVFNYYNFLFKSYKFIKLLPNNPWSSNSLWAYNIIIKGIGKNLRNKLIQKLIKKGIETRPGFYPLSSMPPYKKYSKKKNENSFILGHGSITLPFYNDLKRKEQKKIVSKLISTLPKKIKISK